MTTLSTLAQEVLARIDREPLRMGEIKKVFKDVKKNHALAEELWATGLFPARMLAALCMDKNKLTQEVIEQLAVDMRRHDRKQRDYIGDWLLAHQLMKSKKNTALLASWRHHEDPVLRRLFWYYQGRLRWMGKQPEPDVNAELLDAVEAGLADEEAGVQWAMNFCAAWIGVFRPEHRDRVVAMGKRIGLYADEKAPRGCTPNYLPEFVRIEVGKRQA